MRVEHRHQQIVQQAHASKDAGNLKGPPHAEMRDLVGRTMGYVASIEQDTTPVGPIGAR